MATFSARIVATGDDVTSIPQYSAATDVALGIGLGANGANDLDWMGLRWPAVAVPPGATINSATLTTIVRTSGVFQWQNGARWYGDKVANAPAWTASRPDQISKTAASDVIAGSGAAAETVVTHTITAIVQELVNQPGWASGNAMRFAGDPGQTAPGFAFFYDYVDAAAKAAVLTIDFTAPVAAAPRRACRRCSAASGSRRAGARH